jgi:hypothetical protein
MEGRRKKKKFSVLECRIILWVFFPLYEVADCDWGAKKSPFTHHPKESYSRNLNRLKFRRSLHMVVCVYVKDLLTVKILFDIYYYDDKLITIFKWCDNIYYY